jgi:hypothetical protein
MRSEWRLHPHLASGAVAAVLALAAAACGGEPANEPARPERAKAPPGRAAERHGTGERTAADALPDLVVADTAGGRVALPDLAPRDRPLLVWFWAPH